MDRISCIFSEAALELFEALIKEDERLKEFLVKKYQGLEVSLEMEELAYNYFVNHSVITAATVANPGSSMTTEYLYDGLTSPLPIDSYFLQAKAGRAVKARLRAIEKELPRIVEKYLNKNGEVLIGNLGSGPGRDVIDTLYRYKDLGNVKAVYIDKDLKSLERGQRIATNKGTSHLIEFVPGDFLHYKPTQKFDVALMIGILCPLAGETCTKYLKIVKRLLKPGGCLIVSNASTKMSQDDPFTRFIMEWTANWKLVYKTEEEVRLIFEENGYLWQGSFTDQFGFHIMGMGVAPSEN